MHSEKEEKKTTEVRWIFFSACQTIYDNCWILISPWCLIWCPDQHWFYALGDWTASLSVGVKIWLSHSSTHFVDQKAQSFQGDWNSKNVYCPVDKNFIDYKVHLSTLLWGNPVWLIAMSLWCGYLHFWFKSWVGFFQTQLDYPNLRTVFIYFQIN